VYNIGKNYNDLNDTYAVEIECRVITFNNGDDLTSWVASYIYDPGKSERDFENRLHPAKEEDCIRTTRYEVAAEEPSNPRQRGDTLTILNHLAGTM
jgi:hypothetical protein